MGRFIDFTKKKYQQIKPYYYVANILVFIAKIVLFFIIKSLSFVISSLYNLGIGLARKNIYSNMES